MISIRTLTLAAAAATLGLMAYAQSPADHSGHGKGDADHEAHMKTMQGQHDKMMAAKTPEERQALMAEAMKNRPQGMDKHMGNGEHGMGMKHGMMAPASAPKAP